MSLVMQRRAGQAEFQTLSLSSRALAIQQTKTFSLSLVVIQYFVC